jgi:hypothetical protein
MNWRRRQVRSTVAVQLDVSLARYSQPFAPVKILSLTQKDVQLSGIKLKVSPVHGGIGPPFKGTVVTSLSLVISGMVG